MGLWNIFRGNRKTNQTDGMLELLELFNKSIESTGLDVDEIPGCPGEFGLDVNNPVPTNTALGSERYLSSLRTLEGKSISHRRIGSFSADHLQGTPVDGYSISDDAGNRLCTIYLCMYHKRNSKKAPKGFVLRD